MSLKSERNFWRVVGAVVVVLGLAIMIGAIVIMINNDDPLDKSPSRIQALGTAIALCGVCALVLGRQLSMLINPEGEPNIIWTAVAYGSIALGIAGGLVQSILWMNAVRSGVQESGFTPAQKSGLLAAGFLVMTGVISVIGERTARLYVKQKQLRSGAGAGR